MDRRKVPILINPQTFISNSGNQPESGYKWVFRGALCALQGTASSRGETKLSEWPFLTLKSTSVHKSSLRPFCSILMMLKSCSVNVSHERSNVSHEGSLCVHIWVARHISFWESITCVLCVRLEMPLRGETRFMEMGPSSCSGWNPKQVCAMLCHVVPCCVMAGEGHILTAAWPPRLEKGQRRPCVQQVGLTG